MFLYCVCERIIHVYIIINTQKTLKSSLSTRVGPKFMVPGLNLDSSILSSENELIRRLGVVCLQGVT